MSVLWILISSAIETAPNAVSDVSNAVTAFEIGSGLNVRALGGAISIIGMLVIAVGCAWGVVEQIRANMHGDLAQGPLFARALIGAAVMIFCLLLFASGTVISKY